MRSRVQIIASFARGFFRFLEEQGIRSAVLHGAADGFERPLSDIDFAVDHDGFRRLPSLVRAYCKSRDWLQCQILRHETTAAYHVCCMAEDPSVAVALDACSDYQRNGIRFLLAGELLGSRTHLDWGGYSLAAGTELAYRFSKAAAKHKPVESSIREFQFYDPTAKSDCSEWLSKRFGIQIHDWTADHVAKALRTLENRCRQSPSLFSPKSLMRVISRVYRPSGMVVISGPERLLQTSEALRPVFGDLFFRRYEEAQAWRLSHPKKLVSSTLILLPDLPAAWTRLIPADCQFDARGFDSATSISRELAIILAERCTRREP